MNVPLVPLLRCTVATTVAALVAMSAPRLSHSQTTALVGAKVYPVSSPAIEGATVLIEGDRITAIGSQVDVPDNARRIDVAGKIITPGFIHAYSQVGLIEIGQETVDSRVNDNQVSAGLDLTDAVNPASYLVPVTRAGGVTVVVSVPRGGMISGQALALQLSGESVEDMIVRAPAAMIGHVNASARSYGGGSRAGVFGRLRTLFDDAAAYRARRADFDSGNMRELSASPRDLEALGAVLDRSIPLVLTANRRSDIEAAMRFARQYDVRLVIFGAKEAWMVAGQLAAAQIPVVLDPLENIPSYDALQTRLDNAAVLAAAGVQVSLVVSEEYNPRLLRQQAGNAIAHGMAWEDALRAVTVNPARAFGLAAKRGTLQEGGVADLVVWNGDPFELSTVAEKVIIAGGEMSTETRQTLLMEKYRDLLNQ